MQVNRTCDQLGLCQRSVNGRPCEGASCYLTQFTQQSTELPFAPGVIDGPYGRTSKMTYRRQLTKWLARALALMALCGVLGFVLGYSGVFHG